MKLSFIAKTRKGEKGKRRKREIAPLHGCSPLLLFREQVLGESPILHPE
jgi:hypothetical protein